MRGAFPGNRQDDMRVDGREGDVNHLKLFFRILFAQQHFEIPIGGETFSRIAHCGRLTQNKNPKCAWRFVGAKPHRTGIAHDFPGEESPAEILVLHEKFFAADIDLLEESGIVTIAAKPQRQFQQPKQNKRQQQRCAAEKPQPAPGDGFRGAAWLRTRRLGFVASKGQ